MLVVMGPIMEIPVTDLFAAAIFPGILLATLYAAYTTIRCWIDPSLGPVLPEELRATSIKAVWIEFFLGLVPPAALVFAALGSILFGFATPTEAAGMGACVDHVDVAATGYLMDPSGALATWGNFLTANAATMAGTAATLTDISTDPAGIMAACGTTGAPTDTDAEACLTACAGDTDCNTASRSIAAGCAGASWPDERECRRRAPPWC